MKAVKKLFIACSVIMMFACVTLGTLSLQPVKANAATAEISDLATSLNTSRAKKIRLGTYKSQPITWTVIGYNGAGVRSSANTLTLITTDIVGTEQFSKDGSNTYFSAPADMLNYPMKIHLDGLVNSLDANAKSALVKCSVKINSRTNWSGYFLPIDYDIYRALDESIRDINKKYLTCDGHVSTGAYYNYTQYNTSATNNNRCWTTIDTTKIQSVELGDDGIYTLNFKPADKSVLAVNANLPHAQTVYFGSYDSTDDGVDNPTPIKWRVMGYNGDTGYNVHDKEGYVTLLSSENRFGQTAFGSTNDYASSTLKSKIAQIADVAFSENEKLGIVTEYDDEVLWAPESTAIGFAHYDISFEWWTRVASSTDGKAMAYVYNISDRAYGSSSVQVSASLYIRFAVRIKLSAIDTVTENEDGSFSMTFIEPHVHKWVGKLGDTDNVLTAVCEGKGNCDVTVTPTYTINVDVNTAGNNAYTGMPFAGASATVANWDQEGLEAAPSLVFVSQDGTTYPETETPPTNAGLYTVKATFGGVTAYKNFKFDKASNSVKGSIENFKSIEYGEELVYPEMTARYGMVYFKFSTESDGEYTREVPTEIGHYYVKAYVDESENYKAYRSDYYWFSIKKCTNEFTAQPTIANWKYGATPAQPTGAQAKYGSETIVYMYSSNISDYSTDVPTAVGKHYLKAVVAEGDTYNKAESSVVVFYIEKGDYAEAGKTLCEKELIAGKTAATAYDLSAYITDVGEYTIKSAAIDLDENGIIGTVTADEKQISVTGKAGSAKDKTARIKLTVSCELYEDFDVYVTLKTVGKTTVTINASGEFNYLYTGDKKGDNLLDFVSVSDGYDKNNLVISFKTADGAALDEEPVNAGSYLVTFAVPESDEDFEGSLTVSYEISKTTNGLNENSAIFWGWEFGDENPSLIGTIYGTPVYTYYDKDGNVLDGRPVHAGSYKLSVHADETEYSEEFDSEMLDFVIKKAYIQITVKGEPGYNYDGTAKKGFDPTTLTVTNNYDVSKLAYTYVKTTYGEVVIEGAPTNVGSYAVFIYVPDSEVDYEGRFVLEFEIKKAKNELVDLKESYSIRYGEKEYDLPLTRFGTPAYTFYMNGETVDRPTDIGEYIFVVHVDGTENYDEFTSGEINFEVKGLLFDKSSISFNDFTVEKGSNPNDIKISGELPKGVTVTYEGLPSDLKPGKFTVKAIIHLDPSIYDVDSDNEYIELTATVTVTGASDGGFPVVPVAVGGVATVAVIAVIIAVVLKKKRP